MLVLLEKKKGAEAPFLLESRHCWCSLARITEAESAICKFDNAQLFTEVNFGANSTHSGAAYHHKQFSRVWVLFNFYCSVFSPFKGFEFRYRVGIRNVGVLCNSCHDLKVLSS